MAASVAALAIGQCGCIAAQRSSPAGRDADGRTIGADVGAAKGNATTQPVSGDGAVGQVGGVNAAFTYASAGLGLSLAAVVCLVIITRTIGEISDNATARYEADKRAETNKLLIEAAREVLLAFAGSTRRIAVSDLPE